jgi:heme A synthase
MFFFYTTQRKLSKDYLNKMIAVIKTYIFQLFCIIVFSVIYYQVLDEFSTDLTKMERQNRKYTYLDALFTSVTIQAGVGYAEVFPYTPRTKIIVMVQQIIMISANVLVLYFFSLHLLKRR